MHWQVYNESRAWAYNTEGCSRQLHGISSPNSAEEEELDIIGLFWEFWEDDDVNVAFAVMCVGAGEIDDAEGSLQNILVGAGG